MWRGLARLLAALSAFESFDQVYSRSTRNLREWFAALCQEANGNRVPLGLITVNGGEGRTTEEVGTFQEGVDFLGRPS